MPTLGGTTTQAKPAEKQGPAAFERIRALHEINTAITSSLDLHEILTILLEKIEQLFPYHASSVALLDRVTKKLMPVLCRDVEAKTWRSVSEQYLSNPERSLARRVLESRGPVVVSDVQNDSLTAGYDFYKKNEFVSYVGLPLIAQDEVLGILSFHTKEEMAFSDEDIGFLSALTGQAAVAIHNAHLYADMKRNLDRVAALREVDLAITSTLDLQSVVKVLLEKTALLVPYAAATVRLINEDGKTLRPMGCRNLDEEGWKAATIDRDRDLEAMLSETNCRAFAGDVAQIAGRRPREFFLSYGLASILKVPIRTHRRLTGILSVFTKEKHQFGQDEVSFLCSVASRAATAICNSQLFEGVQTSEKRLREAHTQLQALYAISGATAQSMAIDTVLREVIAKITETFPFQATQIYLFDSRMENLELVASYQAEPGMLEPKRTIRAGGGIVGRAAMKGEPLVIDDTISNPLYKKMSSGKRLLLGSLRFLAVFPIKSKLRTLGVIVVVQQLPRSLSPNEVDLLKVMADAVGITLENILLFRDAIAKTEKLKKKTRELEKANQVKDEFLGVMSHELRTPLHVILGYAAMLTDGVLGEIRPEQREALETIERECVEQLAMVSNILCASMLEHGGLIIESRETSLPDILDELRSSHKVVKNKDLTLVWNYPSDLPLLEIDGVKVRQILQNLLRNAIKFTREGQVTVSVSYLEDAGLLECKVADTGVGIERKYFEMIFEKFRQVDSSNTRAYQGAGLGLYIARALTELLGGRITVESEVGKGSTFTVVLPAARDASS